MQAATFPVRRARTNYRHELRTLTYVTLDEANGGIIRNLSCEGVAVQAVARLQEQQRVRLRFELRFPRLLVEACGQVSWSIRSGQCGIRFVDLPASARLEIDEWIFSNLLDSVARDAEHPRSMFGTSVVAAAEQDGLIVSAAARPTINLEPSFDLLNGPALLHREESLAGDARDPDAQLNWLSRPLSARTLAWMVDSLVVVAGLLLFAMIFLSIAHELPQWQVTLSAGLAAAVFVAAVYWSLFAVFGGPSLGSRLAQFACGADAEEEDNASRFR
jgi:hypothetical protein